MGHVMRCLSIAEEYKRAGEEVSFIVADISCEQMILAKGFSVICLHSVWNDLEKEIDMFVKVIEEHKISRLLIDSYFVTEAYLQELGKHTSVAYIDDIDSFVYPVDLLINYNIYAEKLRYLERYRQAGLTTKFALGCGYAPLRDEFSGVNYAVRETATKVLITSGGTDNYNVVGNVLEALSKQAWFQKMTFYVILGKYNIHKQTIYDRWELIPNVKLLYNVSNMSEYMQKCDIAITAGGSTIYELCSIGVPSILYTLADNQSAVAQEVLERKIMPYVGDVRESAEECANRICKQIQIMWQDKEIRQRYSERMRTVVDGQGSRRLVKVLKRENR